MWHPVLGQWFASEEEFELCMSDPELYEETVLNEWGTGTGTDSPDHPMRNGDEGSESRDDSKGVTRKGGKGDDVLEGGNGGDTLKGGKGNDMLDGGKGHDTLNGGKDDDVLDGGKGNDTLTGGKGNDILNGGHGKDKFAYDAGDFGHDVIEDFQDGKDLIVMMGRSWSDVSVASNAYGDAVVYVGESSITMHNVDASAITEADFIF